MISSCFAEVIGADVCLDTAVDPDDVVAVLDPLLAGGPFRLVSVVAVGAARCRCTFERRHPTLAIGAGNVIDLQHRIARRFDIVSVERRTGERELEAAS